MTDQATRFHSRIVRCFEAHPPDDVRKDVFHTRLTHHKGVPELWTLLYNPAETPKTVWINSGKQPASDPTRGTPPSMTPGKRDLATVQPDAVRVYAGLSLVAAAQSDSTVEWSTPPRHEDCTEIVERFESEIRSSSGAVPRGRRAQATLSDR